MAEAGMFVPKQTIGTVLCCICGIPMAPNAAYKCAICVTSEFDLTKDLSKLEYLSYCPKCTTYLQPPGTRIKAQLESKELLTLCLNKVKNLDKDRLVNAGFIWTEPHSKRLKVRLSVQNEDQDHTVEYVIKDTMCEYCTKAQANLDQWVSVVQVRQRVSHRRTFFFLEQLILRHEAAVHAVRIKQMDHGIDFFFASYSHGLKFVEFLGKVAPVKSKSASKLVSYDTKSNKSNHQYSFAVEICPICREDLICLPREVSTRRGCIGPLVICTKVTNMISLLDPFTLRRCFFDANEYWRECFKSLLSSRQLVEYIVLDLEPVGSLVNADGSKYLLADAQVARASDFGKNDKIFSVRTHLGNLLTPGDYALGYDLHTANINDGELDQYQGLVLPDVILVKKSYEEKRRRKHGKPRAWKLKSLGMQIDESAKGMTEENMNAEYEQFLRDLEENPELRFNISLYRDKEYKQSDLSLVPDVEDTPSVPLEELLADLDLSDAESGGDYMME